MLAVRRVDLYDNFLVAGGTRLAVLLPDSWELDDALEAFLFTHRGRLTFPTHLPERALMLERRVIRFQMLLAGAATARELRIVTIQDDDATGLTTLTLQGWEYDLGEQDNIVHEFRDDGTVDLAPRDAGKTPTQALTDRILPVVPAYWDLGTVTPTVMDDVVYAPGTTALAAVQAIAEAASRRTMVLYEISVVADETGGTLDIALTAVGAGTDVPDVRPSRNLLRLLQESDPREQTTRAIGLGINGAHCGKNLWTVAAVPDGSHVDLEALADGPGPVQEAGQYAIAGEHCYLVEGNGTPVEITGTSIVSTVRSRFTVPSSATFAPGDRVRIALDSTGKELHYVDAPAARAQYGTKLGTLSLHIDGTTNLLAGNADLHLGGASADLIADPPPGLTITRTSEANPLTTIAEDLTDFIFGGRSLRVTQDTNRNAGFVVTTDPTSITTILGTPRVLTAAIWVKVLTANTLMPSDVQILALTGATHASVPVDVNGLAGKGWQQVLTQITTTAFAVLTIGYAIRVRLGTDMLFGGYQLSEAPEIPSFAAGSNPAVIVQEMNRHLYLDEYRLPLRSLDVGLIDLAQQNGTRYPYDRIAAGRSIKITHPFLSAPETLRMLRVTYRSEAPQTPGILLGTRRRGLPSGAALAGGGATITPGGPLPGGSSVIGQNPAPAGQPGSPGAPGAPGAPGSPGAPGVGMPAGGTTNQALLKVDDTDFNTYWGAGGGGGSFGDVVLTTGSLADGAVETGVIALGKSFALARVTLDAAARVRLYATAAYRTADAARDTLTDPTGEHGCIFDANVVAGNLVLDLMPQPRGSNLDTVRSTDIYYAVENKSGGTSVIEVTFYRQVTET